MEEQVSATLATHFGNLTDPHVERTKLLRIPVKTIRDAGRWRSPRPAHADRLFGGNAIAEA